MIASLNKFIVLIKQILNFQELLIEITVSVIQQKTPIEEQLHQPGLQFGQALCQRNIGPIFSNTIITYSLYLNILKDAIIPQLRLYYDNETCIYSKMELHSTMLFMNLCFVHPPVHEFMNKESWHR